MPESHTNLRGVTKQIATAEEAYQTGRDTYSRNAGSYVDTHSNAFSRNNSFKYRDEFDKGWSDQARDAKGQFK